MKKPETKFRERIRPLLAALPNSWWESIQQKTINGTPDIIGCVNGQFVAIELKSERGKVSKLQAYKLDCIRKAKGIAISVKPSEWEVFYNDLKKIAFGDSAGYFFD